MPGPQFPCPTVAWSTRITRARRRAAAVAGAVTVMLVVSSYPFVEPAAAAPTPEPPPAAAPPVLTQAGLEPTGVGLSRPDAVSARVTASASGERVEVLSERTPYARTWALPEGGFESEAVGSPVRFEDTTQPEVWRDVDTTLVANADGTLSPRAVPQPVVLAGKGDTADDLVTSSGAGHALTLGAGVDRALPAPMVDGSTATYPEVLPGVDVQVEVRPTGFEQLWVAKTRAGLDALLSEQASGDQGVAAVMDADKLTATPQADGGVVFTDASKKTVSTLAPPLMWDAETAPDGTPTNEVAGDLDVVKAGDPLPPKTGASGELELSVVPDQAWLDDPARKFPVTIDPTYLSGANQAPVFDTYVKEGTTVDRSTSNYLLAGMGSDGLKHRSFLNFSTAAFQGKHVTTANLTLWSHYTGSCTANGWSAYDAGVASTSSRWTAQPTVGTKYATSTGTKGFDASCPSGSVSIDMKAQVQAWANGSATTKGMALKSDDETVTAGYHQFFSSDAASNNPVLRWTYDRVPAQMTTPTVPQAVSYKPSGSSTSYLYVPTTTPTLTGVVSSDPDGDTLRPRLYAFVNATDADGDLDVAFCTTTTWVAAGSTGSCALKPALTPNTSYWVRGRSEDSNGWWGAWSPGREIRIASQTPAPAAISCPGLTNNTWVATGPSGNVTCTISATGTGYSAPSSIKWSVDGAAWTTTPIPQSTSAATAMTNVTLKNTAGAHRIVATAANPAGLTAPAATFAVGWGTTASLTAPLSEPMTTTTDTVPVAAAGPPRNGGTMPTAKVQWRVSGATGTAGWVDAPAGTSFAVADDTGATGGVKATANFDTTLLVGQADGSAVTVGERTTTLIDLRVCLGYDPGLQCTGPATVQRVPHAFGSGFPQADAGPGQVGLWTGELSVDDTDASLTTPDGGLSVSRTHSSFAGPPAVQNAVFGPGWNASFEGDDSGAGGAEVWDNTHVDGTLAVVDSDGSLLTFATPKPSSSAPPGQRRSAANLAEGVYPPADHETAESGMVLRVSGTGTGTIVELKGDDGTVTKFAATTAATLTSGAAFRTVEVRDTATTTKTTYAYDTAGRVTAIVAALPDGVSSCVPGTPVKGCRVLKISYAADTTPIPTGTGDYPGRVKQISAQVNTDADKTLASYTYDNLGRLVTATDTRTGLATAYTWTGTGAGLRLATLTPPGEAAYTFTYTGNRLFKVTRPNPASAGGGTAQLGAYLYNVPLAGTVKDLPDMTAEPARWGQDRMPTWAAAVFGQDKPITTAPPVGSEDWKSADLQLTDAQGYTLNTASYGAGDWQLTAADYDDAGNVIHAWDDRAIGAIRDGSAPGGQAALQVATITVYNNDIKDPGGTVVTPAGTLVTDTYGPVHLVTAADGTQQPLRTHTANTYDQGAPNSGINPDTTQPYRLPTKTVTTAETVDGTPDATLNISLTQYDPLVTGDTSGWALGQATATAVDMDQSGTVNTGDIVSRTRYDARGRTIETRQPKSNGADAGTKVTTYYTGATTGTTGCTAKPEWSGMTCQSGPAAQPAGQTMPISKTTGYTWDLQPASSVDTSGAVTSTTTTTYNAQDRPTTVATTVSGLTGSTAQPAITTSYDTTTGSVTGTSSSAGSTGMTYDSWGRQLTYTNTPTGQAADTATTTYDTNGRITAVVDGNGQTTYGYDGTDAAGNTERRGLTTSVKVKITGGQEFTSTGAYDDGGDLVLETLPGDIVRRTTIDIAGDQTSLVVNGYGYNPDTNTVAADQPWLGWSTTSNAQSQITREYTPDGGAIADAGQSDRAYTYDRAGRLTQVQDATGTPDTNGVVPCTTRTYTFDDNGNRTGQNSIPAGTDGACATTGGSPITRAYDSADRPTTGGNASGSYVYDQLGRQTSIPAIDTPNPARGNLTLAYYDDDTIRTTSQGTLGSGGTKTTHTLDAANRRSIQTNQTDVGTTTITRHYTDNTDNPTWTTQTTGTTTTTTRYNELIDGDLGLTLTTSSTTAIQLSLTTPRDDIAATVTLTANASAPTGASTALGVDNWNTYTEYGTPQQPLDNTPGSTTGIGYGWLGAKQRATNGGDSLTFMGARLYNSTTALFTTTDPVDQGGDTTYGYPNDPINHQDLNGKYWWRAAWRVGVSAWNATHRVRYRYQSLGVGWAARGAVYATGGRCSRMGYGMRNCYGGYGHLYSGGGTTYGHTFISRRRVTDPALLRHESVHHRQWLRHGLKFGAMYLGSYAWARFRKGRGKGGCNRWEREAGYQDGRYNQCR